MYGGASGTRDNPESSDGSTDGGDADVRDVRRLIRSLLRRVGARRLSRTSRRFQGAPRAMDKRTRISSQTLDFSAYLVLHLLFCR